MITSNDLLVNKIIQLDSQWLIFKGIAQNNLI